MNTINIEYRSKDGKVNATQLCQAGGKKFNHWYTNDKAQAFLKVLSSVAGIPATELFEVNQGGNSKLQATWVHPQVAINIAQWVSPEFDVQVSKWIYELATTGQVKLGEEKTTKELDNLWKLKCEQLEEEKVELLALNGALTDQNEKQLIEMKDLVRSNRYYKIELNRHQIKHRYVKLNTNGPCYYIYHVNCHISGCSGVKVKPGIAGFGDFGTLNERLANHRTTDCDMKLDFVVTSSEEAIRILEKTMLFKYKGILVANNHETARIASASEFKDIIASAKLLIQTMSSVTTDYDFLSEELIHQYNENVEQTLNPRFKNNSIYIKESEL